MSTPNFKIIEDYILNFTIDSDFIMLWLDNDQSGDSTWKQVIDLINTYTFYDNRFILRADFSSLATEDIWTSFENIDSYTDTRNALGFETRTEIDLRVGLAWTVCQSKYLNKIVPQSMNVNSRFSYGPCLFPTLFFWAQRAFDIIKFNPSKYWRIVMTIEDKDGNYVDAEHTSKFKSYKAALERIEKLKGKVSYNGNSQQTRYILKPEPMNTTTMLALSSKLLSMNSTEASDFAQDLYEEGLISYPRTEGNSYSENMVESFGDTLESMIRDDLNEIGDFAEQLLDEGIRYFNSKSSTIDNHPPITPVKLSEKQKVNKRDSKKIELYTLISRYFMATLSKDCTYEENILKFKMNSENFTYRESVIVEEGFLKYYDEPYSKIENIQDAKLKFNNKSKFKILSIRAEEISETPPKYISEAELIEQMKMYGIGTEGTIPKIIKNIKYRWYVEVWKKTDDDPVERIKPTPLGLALAIGYQKIDKSLLEPKIRKFIEMCNEKVADYELEKDTVMDMVVEVFSEKLENFMNEFNTHMTPVIKSFVSNQKKFYLPDFNFKKKQKVAGGYYISEVKECFAK